MKKNKNIFEHENIKRKKSKTIFDTKTIKETLLLIIITLVLRFRVI